MKRSPQDLTEMAAAIGSHEAAAHLWLDEGFSPGDAAAYVAAGCFDVPRTAELRQAGIGALDIARIGLAWEYCSGNLTLAEVRGAVAPVLESETGLLWDNSVSALTMNQRREHNQPHAGRRIEGEKKDSDTKQAEGDPESHVTK